ncbi:MAG: FGGY-family carbohydrate kinase [Candidatus Eremiobacteraeota bacterium]|nr:FGGY-family carbohydrate kinase [Candidatus Eremiobacteraeota bacterium]
MKDVLLAIDNGTQSVRALAFDLAGALLGRTRVLIDDYSVERPGWHEYDPQRFWEKACQACRELFAERPELRERIAGVAVTTQRGTVVNVDAAGKPLRPAITWLDQRKSPLLPPIAPLLSGVFKLAGAERTVRYFQREAEANWIAACEPDVWKATHKYLLLSGYLNYRLTGEFADSAGSQVGYLPFDFKALGWAKPGDWKWQALRVRPETLPALVPPAAPLGTVSATAAADCGIPSGTPVVAAAADKACEVLGAGCLDSTTACLSFGTTATVNVASSRYLEASALVPPYPGALPGTYDVEVQVFRGYWMIGWFKEQFGVWGDELVRSVPPGAMGLMLQPYWSPGLKTPEAKGAIVGFGDVHTRAHVYRAILEGIAYALRDGKERIERRTQTPIVELRVCGGGSQSDAALQLTSDVFGLPASRPHVFETSGLGAAIDAAVGLGLHADFPSAVRAMSHTERTFEPNAKDRALYDALYRRVYSRMYERLQPLYAAIREITGYPAE